MNRTQKSSKRQLSEQELEALMSILEELNKFEGDDLIVEFWGGTVTKVAYNDKVGIAPFRSSGESVSLILNSIIDELIVLSPLPIDLSVL